MATWDYRLIESKSSTSFELYEVYFDASGEIDGWSDVVLLTDFDQDEKLKYYQAWSDALIRPLLKQTEVDGKPALSESKVEPLQNGLHICGLFPDLTTILIHYADIEKAWCYQGHLILQCDHSGQLCYDEIVNGVSRDLSQHLPHFKCDIAELYNSVFDEEKLGNPIYLHGQFLTPEFMQPKILQQLEKIERQYQVNILYACESGSRAWGFESHDSDFDVRFIYVHRKDWYLKLDTERQRDVIEIPPNDLFDINGWDLKKALNLLAKSNPVLFEWFSSPVVYKQDHTFIENISPLLADYFSSQKTFYHYRHMAKGNYREYLQGDRVRLKKYLYVLRPLLAIEWILKFEKPIPMRFQDLVNAFIKDKGLFETIEHLLYVKSLGSEKQLGNSMPSLNQWIEQKLTEFDGMKPQKIETPNLAPLNQVFLKQLRKP